jgi:hypothetical protein
MKYVITYSKRSEPIDSENSRKLFIYDFGHIRGFLYDSTFTMYRMLERDDTNEYVEMYDGVIPKTAFSIEEYDCNFKESSYSIQDYDIIIKHSLQASLSAKEFYPQQQRQTFRAPFLSPLPVSLLPPPQKRPSCIKRSSPVEKRVEKNLEEVSVKKQPVSHYQPLLSDYHTPLQSSSWTSLDQLLRSSSPSSGPKLHLQHLEVKQYSRPLKQKKHSSSQVRTRQVKVEKEPQNLFERAQDLQKVTP